MVYLFNFLWGEGGEGLGDRARVKIGTSPVLGKLSTLSHASLPVKASLKV